MLLTWLILIYVAMNIDLINNMEFFVQLSSVPTTFIFFSAYLYYEALINRKPPIWRFSIFFGSFILLLGMLYVSLAGFYFIDLLFGMAYLMGTGICIYAMAVLSKTYKITKHKGLKIDFIAFCFMLIGCIIYQIYNYLVVIGIMKRFSPESSSLSYYRNFHFDENEFFFERPEEIVGGALMAFSSFFEDILGTKTRLRFIDAYAYAYLFSSLP